MRRAAIRATFSDESWAEGVLELTGNVLSHQQGLECSEALGATWVLEERRERGGVNLHKS